ncbi:fimbria/pilus outer membrane usher protein [Bordetella genomosp. 4]|uniref:Fimbrial assembly protein n=1 Tax=Bordetella genomosp. 4 TaxID=463044 RepID=A0A261V1F5_9BORD|nr:fimbria/pilus outer membrane usher protein [Bordetella genomosp. 4]OZI67681.1 fimbrial assembly protein [Bordetella genomosp. 4]
MLGRRRFWIAVWWFGILLVIQRSYAANALPPAPGPVQADAAITYYLGLTVNGQDRGRVEPVQHRDGHFWVQAATLRSLGLHVPADAAGLVAVDQLPDVTVDYDAAHQMLHLRVPSEWLPRQHVGGQGLIPREQARSSLGALFNYDVYYSDPARNARSYVAALTEQRIFDGFGVISNTGVYTRYLGHDAEFGSNQRDRYVRYDTYWRYNDQRNMLSYQVGDYVSGSLNWSNAVRMGGLRFSRNFAVRPDLVTYPLLNFNGDAAVPGAVDLFINGAKASSAELQAGPFTLSNVPYINGAGQATVVTTDALGRQVTTSLPFYVSNTLLAPGLSDFDLSVGKLRQDYGLRNFSYDTTAVSGTYRYGVSQYLTLAAHGESATGLKLAGAGADIGVGVFGTLSLAASNSHSDSGNGQQYLAGYSYYSRRIGLALQRVQRVGDYSDLSNVNSVLRLARRSDQATGTLSLDGLGTLGAGYFDVRADDGSRTRLLNLSYNRSLWGNSSVYLSLNKELGGKDYSAFLQFVIPLGQGGMVNVGVTRDTQNRYSERAIWSRAVPSQGGVGWNVGYGGGAQHYQQADMTWRTQGMQIQGGLYGERDNYTRWADLSGSLVWMDNAVFASNQINDAFVVVNTEGYRDVPVRYENQLMGRTDENGHLLVPWVASYYPAKFAIDTLQLPANVRAGDTEQRVAVSQGSGFLLNFSLQTRVSATVTLVDADGQSLPLGSQATERNSKVSSVVGWDGQVYFEGLQDDNRVHVTTPDGRRCQVVFTLDTSQAQIAQVGPLTCALSASGAP